MYRSECYISLGGNLPKTQGVMQQAVHRLALLEGIFSVQTSPLYRTSPLSDIPQPPYLNAVCKFWCSCELRELWQKLQLLEIEMGKQPKPKNAPRLIDIDLLFFGSNLYYSHSLVLPHPKWHERLFVLAPLADVTDTIPFGINIKEMLKKFSNPHKEIVTVCGSLT